MEIKVKVGNGNTVEVASLMTIGDSELLLEFLYPTQRVAEGIMFLTRPSVSQSVSPSVLFFLLAQLL